MQHMRKVAYTLGELFWVEAVGCQEGGLCEVFKQCAAGTAPLGVHFYILICDGLIRKTKMLLLRPTVPCATHASSAGETRRLCMSGKDAMQEFCDPKEWQQLAQVRVHLQLRMKAT
jgi:hypothetical protein